MSAVIDVTRRLADVFHLTAIPFDAKGVVNSDARDAAIAHVIELGYEGATSGALPEFAVKIRRVLDVITLGATFQRRHLYRRGIALVAA